MLMELRFKVKVGKVLLALDSDSDPRIQHTYVDGYMDQENPL